MAVFENDIVRKIKPSTSLTRYYYPRKAVLTLNQTAVVMPNHLQQVALELESLDIFNQRISIVITDNTTGELLIELTVRFQVQGQV